MTDQSANSSPIVTSQIPVKRRLSRNLLIAAAVVVLIVGGSVWAWKIHSDNAKKAAIAADNKSYANLLKEVAYNTSTNPSDYEQIANAWMSYAEQAPTKTHKAAAYQEAGTEYLNGKDPAKALEAFQGAAAISGITYGEANDLAIAEAQVGHKDAAIYYFQQAIKLIPTKNFPDAGAQRQLFNQEIAELKAEQ